MKKFICFINNLKIKYKVLICMLSITTIALLSVSFLSYNYFSNRLENQTKSNASHTLKIASKALSSEFNLILSSTSRFLSNAKVVKTLKDIDSGSQDRYIYNYVSLDNDFAYLMQSHDYISSAFFIDKYGKFYSSADLGLNYDTTNYFNWDLSNVNGITLLPVKKSPVTHDTNVLPLVIPISYETRMNICMVSDSPKDSTVVFVILLDLNKINQYFNHINNNKGSVLYLADCKGLPLSIPEISSSYKLAKQDVILDKISKSKDAVTFDEKMDHDTYMVSGSSLDFNNMKLVSIALKKDLLSDLASIRSFILISWLICSLVSIFLSIVLSKFISHPINSLVHVVESIQEGKYETKLLPKYHDEVGILNHSINEMYDTIQQQIVIIKEDAQSQAAAEISLLSDQINPHFLYNTLECIHFEILNSHTEEAAAMIESLGRFLRIGLNYGNNLIPMHLELTHAGQYMKLMNHMSNQKIEFRTDVDDVLKEYKILKLILQPLIENSIKHGFQKNGMKQNIFAPFIEVRVQLKENQVIITVTDNGVGIDMEKAKASLYQMPAPDSNHVGLNNIYRRLRVFYGESVSITFFSVPLCQNEVNIFLPYLVDKND
ncbi:cache domain-containing sensor histidine kinase [Anaerocolumna jejuensis]|uniref:cache domain-containing sensor histidine kinase n=1 Tax=Anaerocolumna jejuensis TaxID=259063 RepID=UPI003F7C8D0B